MDILPLQKLVTHLIALKMYKYSHGMLPQMIQDGYVTKNAVHHYSTRQSILLHVQPGVHTNNFRYKSILIWSKLSMLSSVISEPSCSFILKGPCTSLTVWVIYRRYDPVYHIVSRLLLCTTFFNVRRNIF